MNKLRLFNVLFAQWWGFRLSRSTEGDWGVMLPVMPLTGWYSPSFPCKRIALVLQGRQLLLIRIDSY